MEEISTSYDDATIRRWAKDIRKMKIRELNNIIKEHEKYFKCADQYFYPERYIAIVHNEIEKLKAKLDILKRK
jgi:hypothetical protein